MHPQASTLARLRPKLFHMTSPGAYRSIFDHGLLSTALLLETYGWKPEAIDELITTPRTDYVTIEGIDGRDPARLIHQRPINPAVLGKSLALDGDHGVRLPPAAGQPCVPLPERRHRHRLPRGAARRRRRSTCSPSTRSRCSRPRKTAFEVSRHNSGASPR